MVTDPFREEKMFDKNIKIESKINAQFSSVLHIYINQFVHLSNAIEMSLSDCYGRPVTLSQIKHTLKNNAV